MNVSFLASDLGKWDGAENVPETLVLPFFVDERPLRGAAGLCDWRLCGRLSRLLQSSRVIADKMMKLGHARYALVPPGRSTGRLSARRALEIYLGEAQKAQAAADVVVVESVAGQKEAAELARSH
ncbi:MAG: hypothetical protein LC659_11815 [Myxococcales bacterium]|nr:hypothetical protein [Myxococcales bacterium]